MPPKFNFKGNKICYKNSIPKLHLKVQLVPKMCKSINLFENYIRLWYNTIQVLIIRTKKSIQNKNYRKDGFS